MWPNSWIVIGGEAVESRTTVGFLPSLVEWQDEVQSLLTLCAVPQVRRSGAVFEDQAGKDVEIRVTSCGCVWNGNSENFLKSR